MHESVLHLCKFQNVPGYHVIQHHLLCSSSVTGARHHAHLPRTQISNDDIPIVLRNLSLPEICSLHPQWWLHSHGKWLPSKRRYFRLKWSRLSVEEKVNALPDIASRQRTRAPYHHLINDSESSYKEFVMWRHDSIEHGQQFNLYDYQQRSDVECCLWPHLYPTRQWCETNFDGGHSRLSSKIAFVVKVNSQIADYTLSHKLLHFHYDLWLFKTVSGAISCGRQRQCSPARSLQTKAFSVEYWKWQHRFLLDAVVQHGPPFLFLTISPYGWSFPLPLWLTSLREVTGKGLTELALLETSHIVHVLEQIIRGYLWFQWQKMEQPCLQVQQNRQLQKRGNIFLQVRISKQRNCTRSPLGLAERHGKDTASPSTWWYPMISQQSCFSSQQSAKVRQTFPRTKPETNRHHH